MTARLWVVGRSATSLRQSLNETLSKDQERRNPRYPVLLMKQKKVDRQRGWSWVHSRNEGKGALKYRWNRKLKILECWAVTKGANRPSQLIGEFVDTLLATEKHQIKSIHIDVS